MKKAVYILIATLLACALSGFAPAALAESEYAGTTITVYNWYDYIDPDVVSDFTKETGIKVNYVCFTTNEEMYVHMTKGEGKYDVIVHSDYII